MKSKSSSIVAVATMMLAAGSIMTGALAAERARSTEGKPMTPEQEIQQSNLPDATKAERKLLIKPGDRKTRIEAAKAHLAQGADQPANVEAAQTHALAVLAETPQDLESLLLAGQTSLLMNDAVAAARYYRAATLIAPDKSSAFIGLGDALTRLRDEPGANAAFERYRALMGLAPLPKADNAK